MCCESASTEHNAVRSGQKELRRQVFYSFRDPAWTDNNQSPWPWIYGHVMDIPPAHSPRQNAAGSFLRYAALGA